MFSVCHPTHKVTIVIVNTLSFLFAFLRVPSTGVKSQKTKKNLM